MTTSKRGERHPARPATQATPIAPSSAPHSFEELWERLEEWSALTVTADRRTVLGLDAHPQARTWAAQAWAALGALNSYATAVRDGYSGGFYRFCQVPPSGALAFPIRRLAMAESLPTVRRFGRLFPGPDGGLVEMQAHLKLGTRGTVAPRLYFLDEVTGAGDPSAGYLVVGYLGPHLRNRKTN
ncbi:hypothetical protein [Streptomyces sp. bgisy060]|uniref:hypothetical protein n=1 Tax=Streptomyces sp. bgisy060 TaxID=3413775 RepID=UPI003EBA7591